MKKIGVVGAGTMGGGIAQHFAQHGYQVLLWDENFDTLECAVQRMKDSWKRLYEKNKINVCPEELVNRIVIAKSMEDFSCNLEVVFEAVIEKIDVKQELFRLLSEIVPETTILASNTSTMSITEIALKTTRSERVVGTHYFYPVPVMKLVEIVKGAATSIDTLKRIESLLESVNKTTVRVEKSIPGFIVNRILVSQLVEALELVEKGVATPEEIDLAVTEGLRYPMGPFRLMDFSGIDVVYRSMQYMYEESGDNRYKPPRLLKDKFLQKHWGEKSGKGFYNYSEGE